MKNGKQFTGFAWGGDWKGFCYAPHFEMTGGLTVKDLQNGRPVFKDVPVKSGVTKQAVGEIDSHWGLHTTDAMRRFQSVYLPREVDGVYGSNSRAALLKQLKNNNYMAI